ncbi:hypothetical protein TNCV_1134201 [Trichonephila clavipes]|nr:hypothetical protein TNCV_1134201 [Trichonephila clavipes]
MEENMRNDKSRTMTTERMTGHQTSRNGIYFRCHGNKRNEVTQNYPKESRLNCWNTERIHATVLREHVPRERKLGLMKHQFSFTKKS